MTTAAVNKKYFKAKSPIIQTDSLWGKMSSRILIIAFYFPLNSSRELKILKHWVFEYPKGLMKSSPLLNSSSVTGWSGPVSIYRYSLTYDGVTSK